jgi:hypothetical protein
MDETDQALLLIPRRHAASCGCQNAIALNQWTQNPYFRASFPALCECIVGSNVWQAKRSWLSARRLDGYFLKGLNHGQFG